MKRVAKTTFAIVAASMVAACEPTYTNHGFAPQVVDLDELQAGSDTRGSVLRKLGQPSAYSSFDSKNWYYTASRVEHYAFYAPEVIERRVVAIRYDDNGLVAEVNRFGVEDGQVIDLITRRTPTYGREVTVLQQIFGNLGRVSAGDVIGGGNPAGIPGSGG